MHAIADDQLAPGFLVAPPALGDPNFDQSVVLLLSHDDSGSMGFVINRYADMGLHDILESLEIAPALPDRVVLSGGPVSRYAGFVLYEHEPGEAPFPGLVASPTFAVSPSRDLLQLAAEGRWPGRFELLLGYAGWGPGQLAQELEAGSWLHAAFDEELLFDVPVAQRWHEAWARLGIHPTGFMSVPGGAQA